MRGRRALEWAFALLAGGALGVSLVVLIVLIAITALQAGPITSMRATAQAGISLSLRSMDVPGTRDSLAYASIAQVESGSPAAGLGMSRGDALIEVAGVAVDRPSRAWDAVGEAAGGQEVNLSVVWIPRSEITLGTLRAASTGGEPCVLLTSPSVAAQAAGLRAGDALVAAAGIPITGTRQAWEALVVAARTQGTPIELTLDREGERQVVLWDPSVQAELRFVRDPVRAWWTFLTSLNEPRYPERAGLLPAFVGSVYVVLVMAVVAFPLGIAGAVYLEEYAPTNVLTRIIEVLVANLAGTPSAVVGIIGLEVFARALGAGRSVLAGGLTLSILILPMLIVAAREALRSVPQTLRDAALAVGATRWETVRHHVLPYALPGILTGTILSFSRALGEAAPLLLLGAFLFVTYVPQGLRDSFTVVPLQIFEWATRPQDGFAAVAAAAIVILVALLLVLNAVAIVLRNRFQRRWSG
ncbi:MAG TPA: phosphate ABC transporter permease PstA [Candidatus Bipolaricaulis sp.]|nr:phosphate ABC transporter permease PstA [Candidatus Bipolaricaulis sp.]HRS13660.1 phosphate ABC transporter permease PstA [Candidatus Bipolaricaulis sp.]HRU21632.1 phosphate ABC transporter permease PstA [Candidatus Bipolaricaulis sp.]